jgi:copper(I)-binding protein
MKQVVFLSVLVTGCLVWLGAQRQPEIIVRDGWMYSTDSGAITGAFLTIENRSSVPDTIVSAQSDCAEHTEIHTTIRNADGTMGMRPIDQLVVPAGKTVVLKPRSLHVMLYHTRHALRPGETCILRLQSKRNGELQLPLTVRRR